MNRFFKSFLSVMAVALTSWTWAAEPVATWTDFNDLGQHNVTLDPACIVNGDGSVTLGGSGLVYTPSTTSAIYSGRKVTVVMQVSNIQQNQKLVDLLVNENNHVNLYYSVSGNTKELQQRWNETNYGKKESWSPTGEIQTIVVTYKGATGEGITTYLGKDELIGKGAAFSSSGNISQITIPAAGMILHSLTIYEACLDSTGVQNLTFPALKHDFATYFNGNAFVSGWFKNWSEGTPGANDYSATPHGKGFSGSATPTQVTTTLPYGDDFSIALYANLSQVAAKSVVWSVGGAAWTGAKGFAFVKKTDAEVALVQYQSKNATTLATLPILSNAYDLYTVSIDQVSAAEGDTAKTTVVLGVGSETAEATVGAFTPASGILRLASCYGDPAQIGYTSAAGIVIDEVYGWNRALTQDEIQSAAIQNPAIKNYERSVTDDEKWQDEDWGEGLTAPAQANAVTLNATNKATLTMDANATVVSLTIDGEGDLTLTKTVDVEYKLAASETTINADTSIEAGTASLGAVTIADNKTLTVKDNATIGTVSGGTLVIDATGNPIDVNNSETKNSIRQSSNMMLVLKGAESSGVTLNYLSNSDAVDEEFGPRLKVESGTHTFGYGNNFQNNFATGDSDENPTIEVASGAKLNFEIRDLSGWQGASAQDKAVLKVRAGGELEFKNHGSSTAYFRDRLYIEGSTDIHAPTMVRISNSNKQFVPYGGTGETTAQFYVPAGAENALTYAKIGGNQIKTDQPNGATGGFAISVGENATLFFDTPLTAGDKDVNKYGTGTLVMSGANTANSQLSINVGELSLTGTWGGNIKIASGATLLGTGTISGTLTLEDGATIDATKGAVTVTVNDAVELPNTFTIKMTSAQDDVGVVAVLNASNVNIENKSVTILVDGQSATDEYVWHKNETTLSLVKSSFTVVDTLEAQVANAENRTLTLSDVLNGNTLGANATLTINFGDKGDGDATPGTFVFDNTTDASFASITVIGTNGGTIQIAEGVKLTCLSFDRSACPDVTIPVALFNSFTANSYEVAAGKTLKLTGDADVAKTVTVNGTLKAAGNLNFTAANTVNRGGTLEVVSGETSFNAADQGIKGTLTIDNGATFKNVLGSDALAYNTNGVVVNVYGTLDMGATRWTIFAWNNTINVYADAEITGVGQSGNGALDVWEYNDNNPSQGSTAINIYKSDDYKSDDGIADIILSAKFRYRNGKAIFNIDQGICAEISSSSDVTSNVGGIKVIGSGTLKLTGANTYSGGTEIAAGATLVVASATALGTGGITLDGTLTFKDVEATLRNAITQTDPSNTTNPMGQIVIDNSTVTLNGANGNYKGVITVNAGATLMSVTDNYAPFGNGSSIVNNGAIDVTNNGTGDCAISAAISGSGSLTVNDGTLILKAANKDYAKTITVKNGATLCLNAPAFDATSDDTVANTCTLKEGAEITTEAGATVYLTSGGGYFSINGEGKVIVDGGSDVLFGMGGIKNTISANIEIPAEKEFHIRAWNTAATLSGGDITVNGSIVADGGVAGALKVEIANGKTLSGTGTINVPLTLADGATIDATTGAVNVANVTYNGAITVRVPGVAETKVLGTTTSLPTSYVIKQGQGENTLSTVMLVAKTGSDVAGIYAVEPTVVPIITVDDENVAVADSNLTAIKAAAAAQKVDVTSVVGKVLVPADGGTPAKTVDVAGLELFENVPVTVDAGGVATVAYAFGIQNITVATIDGVQKIVVTAKVDKLPVPTQEGEPAAIDEAPAPTFAEGVTVNLYQANGETLTPIDADSIEIDENKKIITITSEKSVEELLTLGGGTSKTLQLKVKAEKAVSSDTGDTGSNENQ